MFPSTFPHICFLFLTGCPSADQFEYQIDQSKKLLHSPVWLRLAPSLYLCLPIPVCIYFNHCIKWFPYSFCFWSAFMSPIVPSRQDQLKTNWKRDTPQGRSLSLTGIDRNRALENVIVCRNFLCLSVSPDFFFFFKSRCHTHLLSQRSCITHFEFTIFIKRNKNTATICKLF